MEQTIPDTIQYYNSFSNTTIALPSQIIPPMSSFECIEHLIELTKNGNEFKGNLQIITPPVQTTGPAARHCTGR